MLLVNLLAALNFANVFLNKKKRFFTSVPLGSLNRVPASVGGKGGNVTSVRWQVTLCDDIMARELP